MLTQIRRFGRPLRRASLSVDKAMTGRETRQTLGEDPILIFSMGKTGTSSLYAALGHASGRPVLKAHALSRDGIARRTEKELRLGVSSRPRFWWSCETIADAFAEIESDAAPVRPWDLLCGVRDPIALAVSDHFYGLQRQGNIGLDPWLCGDNRTHAMAIEENLTANFIDRDWFRDELEATTGIDVYAQPFPSTGFAEYSHAPFRALVIRNEDLAATGPRAIAEFLGLDAPLLIERENVGQRDDADAPYRRFLDAGHLGAAVVDAVYETAMARHFYTETERASLRVRWTLGGRR